MKKQIVFEIKQFWFTKLFRKKYKIICLECGKKDTPTWNWGKQKPDICDECIKIGWNEATEEDLKELETEANRRIIYKELQKRNK